MCHIYFLKKKRKEKKKRNERYRRKLENLFQEITTV